MTEIVYRMDGEDVPESGMKEWHNSRGIPWGATFDGPEPKTISKMATKVMWHTTIHLANEHSVNPDRLKAGEFDWAHAQAHLYGRFRPGQEHYHGEIEV